MQRLEPAALANHDREREREPVQHQQKHLQRQDIVERDDEAVQRGPEDRASGDELQHADACWSETDGSPEHQRQHRVGEFRDARLRVLMPREHQIDREHSRQRQQARFEVASPPHSPKVRHG